MTIEPADPHGEDAVHCLERYFADVSILVGGEASLALHPTPPTADLTPPRGVFLVARDDATPIGCGALLTQGPAMGYVSRMWVASEARGRGVGRRVLEGLEAWSRRLGHERIRLYTHRDLHQAQALYRAAGYEEVEPFFEDAPFADVFFEKML